MSRLSDAANKARDWTEKRDQLIRQERHLGASLRKIAAVTGLSHTQVANICRDTPQDDA